MEIALWIAGYCAVAFVAGVLVAGSLDKENRDRGAEWHPEDNIYTVVGAVAWPLLVAFWMLYGLSAVMRSVARNMNDASERQKAKQAADKH